MSLDYAILGFLNYDAFSGYDLKKAFDNSVRHFWAADQSQIYRTLTRLVESGWAEMDVIHQETRPDRKVYHITPTGKETLRNWLLAPLPSDPSHSAELIQVFFAGQLSDEEVLAHFRRHAGELHQLLAVYALIPEKQSFAQEVDMERDGFFWMLTLECGIQSAQAQLRWVESVIERLEKKTYTLNLSIER